MGSENTKIENPNAFPYVIPGDKEKGWDAEALEGMNLRDYFANTAMNTLPKPSFYHGDKETQLSIDDLAKKAYMIADAMLKQRSK